MVTRSAAARNPGYYDWQRWSQSTSVVLASDSDKPPSLTREQDHDTDASFDDE